jgi:ABC-type iron transport system FetAB ATPase subunit
MNPHVLTVQGLTRNVGGRELHSDLSFQVGSFVTRVLLCSITGDCTLCCMRLQVSTGEVLFIKGPSGVGKTLLLRSLAALDPFDSGTLSLDGSSPRDLGRPAWRAAVTYVHQQRVALPGTPSDLYLKLQQLGAQRGRERGDLQAIAVNLGLEPDQFNQLWRELSVRGEGCD